MKATKRISKRKRQRIVSGLISCLVAFSGAVIPPSYAATVSTNQSLSKTVVQTKSVVIKKASASKKAVQPAPAKRGPTDAPQVQQSGKAANVFLQGKKVNVKKLLKALKQSALFPQDYTEQQLRVSITASNEYTAVVEQAYSFMESHGVYSGSFAPVLFVKGTSLGDNSAFAVLKFNIVVVSLDAFQAVGSDTTAQRNWIVIKAAHEATHCSDYHDNHNVAPLVTEANAYNATWKAMEAVGGDPDQIQAQKNVAAAFNVLAGANGQTLLCGDQFFNTRISKFRYINYSDISFPTPNNLNIVRITLYMYVNSTPVQHVVDVDVTTYYTNGEASVHKVS